MAKVASKEATTGKPKSKGRQRIAIALILNKARRQVTFSKRKAGLLNKARELALRYDAQIAVILFSAAGKVFTFGSPSVDSVLRRLAPLLPGEPKKEESAAPEQTRVEDVAGGEVEVCNQQYQTQFPASSCLHYQQRDDLSLPGCSSSSNFPCIGSGSYDVNMNGFQLSNDDATGMGNNAMDNANDGYLCQKPRMAADHYYEYFTDDMVGFPMQAPGSSAAAHQDFWPNLCGIDDWSCNAVVPAEEYPYPSMDVAAGSSFYTPAASSHSFATGGAPAIATSCNKFVGENSYEHETQCFLDGDLQCAVATSHSFGLEQLIYPSDVAEGFFF